MLRWVKRKRASGRAPAAAALVMLTLLAPSSPGLSRHQAAVDAASPSETGCVLSTQANSSGVILCNGEETCPGIGFCTQRTFNSPSGTTYSWCACEDPEDYPFLGPCHVYVYYNGFAHFRLCSSGSDCAGDEVCDLEAGTHAYKRCVCTK